jgi:threonine/homoserine/homoserine lactone efflux protein
VVGLWPWARLQLILGACGALLLVWMAWGALRNTRREHTPMAPQPGDHADLLLGALLSLANPFAVVYWLSIGASLLSKLDFVHYQANSRRNTGVLD